VVVVVGVGIGLDPALGPKQVVGAAAGKLDEGVGGTHDVRNVLSVLDMENNRRMLGVEGIDTSGAVGGLLNARHIEAEGDKRSAVGHQRGLDLEGGCAGWVY